MKRISRIPISCEFFPPNTPIGAEKLKNVREDLLDLADFEYFSVTYGAGGTSQERTINLVKQLNIENKVPCIAHLTCVAAEKQSLIDLINEYKSLNIKGILALRGDLQDKEMQLKNDLNSALQLVELIREYWSDAYISVAAYPEKHPKAASVREDLASFAAKCKSGANEAVTQYFFNPDSYARFVEDAYAFGVDIPIVPGIMPITNYKQIANFSESCGAEIPRWIKQRLIDLQDDIEGLCEFGLEVVVGLCERLIALGAPALHFYSMNKSEPLLSLIKALGLTRDC